MTFPTKPGRRLPSALALAVLATLGVVQDAFARAGGGSAHFGGGGGGGGGGFHGGGYYSGGGSGGHIHIGPTAWIVIGSIVGVVVLVIALVVIWVMISGRRDRERSERVERAALEAAEDDDAFAPNKVKAAARDLFTRIQNAWLAGDRKALSKHLGPDLLREWERRLDDLQAKGWRNVVANWQPVTVRYVGLTNRADDRDDRVVVHIQCMMDDYVVTADGRHLYEKGRNSKRCLVQEYWTLGKRDGRWILLSIEDQSEGRHEETEALVVAPESDDERLREQAVYEQASADKVADGFSIGDAASVSFDGDARTAALDLSLVDGRFALDVLETSARRAVEAWAEAVDGDDTDLLAIATPAAAQALLYPTGNDSERVVVRGPQLRRLEIAALDPHAEPATMTVKLDLRGRRYIQNRDTTAVVSGSSSHAVNFSETWTLALQGDDAHPWQIVGVDGRVPAAALPSSGNGAPPAPASGSAPPPPPPAAPAP